jgi:quercetin dioxygenase-like cupin family protein
MAVDRAGRAMRSVWLWPFGLLALLLVCVTAAAPVPTPSPPPPPIFFGLRGTLLLENERVRVERFELAPGQSTGRHERPTDQLLVFIRGGVLRSLATGRRTLWREGRVLWQAAAVQTSDAGSQNAGDATIVMIAVSLKPPAPRTASTAGTTAAKTSDPFGFYLNYPNIPGEDLLENDRVVVQRFLVNPGQWEGVHAHNPNMLYIHVRGGQWAARSNKEAEHAYPQPSPDGEVGWMPPIDISEGHQSGNIGQGPIDLIWVTLKE